MHRNTIIGVAAAIVVVAGGFYFFMNEAQAPGLTAKQNVAWSFADKGTDAQGTPRTEVSLNGRVVGTYEGSCAEIDGTSWMLSEGEKSGVICWWAGGGKEIGVFEGDIVKVGDLDEGSAETPGFRGNYQTVFEL